MIIATSLTAEQLFIAIQDSEADEQKAGEWIKAMNSNDNLPPGLTAKALDEAIGGQKDTCPDCEGKKATSGCCDAEFDEPGYPDNDLCSICHEHSEPLECERCDGTGTIDTDAEAAQRREDAEEHKADIERDDRMTGDR